MEKNPVFILISWVKGVTAEVGKFGFFMVLAQLFFYAQLYASRPVFGVAFLVLEIVFVPIMAWSTANRKSYLAREHHLLISDLINTNQLS